MNIDLIQEKLNRITKHSSMIEEVEYFDLVDSTNTYCLKRVKDKNLPKGGFLVIANQQSQGRGRREKEWESPKEGLYFSFILDGLFPPLFSLIVGLSVSEAIDSEYFLKTFIKWPNDVFIEGKKVSGILIETSSEKSIIGIGINTISPNVLSLETAISIGKKDRSLSFEEKIDLIITFLEKLEGYLQAFNNKGFNGIRSRIEQKLLFMNQRVGIEMSDKIQKGILKGIGESGEVLLLIDEELHAFHSGSLVKINI